MGLSGDLESFRVGPLPTIYYIPDYLSQENRHRLLHQINVGSSTKWKSLKNRRLQNWGGVVHEKGLLPQKLPPWLSDLTGNICKDLELYPSPINHVLINEYLPGQGIMPHQDGPAYYPVVAIVSLGSPAVMHFTPHQRLVDRNTPISAHPLAVILMPGSLLVFKDAAYQDYLHGISDCLEHEVDEKTLNLDNVHFQNVHLVGAQDTSLDGPLWDKEKKGKVSSELDLKDGVKPPLSGVVKRSGTRVSLTCRLVTKVHKNLFKF